MPGKDGFDPVTAPVRWEGLKKLNQPALPVLAEFVHGCSKDPAKRTAAVSLFVVGLCQLAGRGMTARLPSAIVVNAHDLSPDPLDMLPGWLFGTQENSGPRVHKEGLFMHETPDQAPAAMTRAIVEKQKLGKVTAYNASKHSDREEQYFAAQRTGFGYGPSRSYAEAWHDVFQLMTDRNDEVILRIERPKDRALFRQHVIDGDKRLRQPLGYGAGLKLVPKHIALSGFLPASLWDAPLAKSIVELGLPLLMLPSTAKTPPQILNEKVFEFITTALPQWCSDRADRVEEPANFVPGDWFEGYARQLRARLRHLPPDYEYTMHKMARQLFPVCLRIASWCGTYSGSSTEEITALTYDLCGHALRGLVLSVAGLAWHGLGIDPGCPHQTTVRVLEYLRSREPMTKSELRRGAHLGKEERDLLIEHLAAENLVRIEGKVVTATSYAEFVEHLYARREFSEPKNHWAAITREDQRAA